MLKFLIRSFWFDNSCLYQIPWCPLWILNQFKFKYSMLRTRTSNFSRHVSHVRSTQSSSKVILEFSFYLYKNQFLEVLNLSFWLDAWISDQRGPDNYWAYVHDHERGVYPSCQLVHKCSKTNKTDRIVIFLIIVNV